MATLTMADVRAQLSEHVTPGKVKFLTGVLGQKLPADNTEVSPGFALALWLYDFMINMGVLHTIASLREQVIQEYGAELIAAGEQMLKQVRESEPLTVHRMDFVDKKYVASTLKPTHAFELVTGDFVPLENFKAHWDLESRSVNLATLLMMRLKNVNPELVVPKQSES
jgi:hypothetical protein